MQHKTFILFTHKYISFAQGQFRDNSWRGGGLNIIKKWIPTFGVCPFLSTHIIYVLSRCPDLDIVQHITIVTFFTIILIVSLPPPQYCTNYGYPPLKIHLLPVKIFEESLLLHLPAVLVCVSGTAVGNLHKRFAMSFHAPIPNSSF